MTPVVLVLVLAAACGTAPATSSPVPSIAPSPTAAVAATPTPAAGEVTVDPSLLAILPAEVDGLPITENSDGEAAALGDPLLAEVAAAIAAGFAFDAATGEFVYAVVVRLLPGAMDGAVFRDWRDSYDEGACSQADGVLNHAETELGGRTVYIGACTGGLRTYHVWLEERGVLVSVSAVGERRLGERLVENLRP
ncbi:MAG: hypothetical protein L0227_06135 [Chloroflexi bacterium]|nr:hypothetical protein [Chloroflexota bacterium]